VGTLRSDGRRPPIDDMLRFPSAVKHDPAIDTWLRLAQLIDAAYVDIRARLRK